MKAALGAFLLAYAVDYGRVFYTHLQLGSVADLAINPVSRGEGVSVGGAVTRSREILRISSSDWRKTGRRLETGVFSQGQTVTVYAETELPTLFFRYMGVETMPVRVERTQVYARR